MADELTADWRRGGGTVHLTHPDDALSDRARIRPDDGRDGSPSRAAHKAFLPATSGLCGDDALLRSWLWSLPLGLFWSRCHSAKIQLAEGHLQGLLIQGLLKQGGCRFDTQAQGGASHDVEGQVCSDVDASQGHGRD